MNSEHTESTLQLILDLLSAAGYLDAANYDQPPSQKIAAGLSWCIAALDASDTATIGGDYAQCIEEALRSVGCPHPLRSSDLRDLDTEAIFPVIQWLALRFGSPQENVWHSEHAAEKDERSLQELDTELEKTKVSIKSLTENLDKLVGFGATTELCSGLLQQQKPFMHPPRPFHQLQMLTLQHLLQIMFAQRNLVFPSASDESRRLGMLLTNRSMSLNKDCLSIPVGVVVSSVGSLLQGGGPPFPCGDTDLLMKVLTLFQLSSHL